MICPYCNSEISDESKFCPNCGAPLMQNTAEGNAYTGIPQQQAQSMQNPTGVSPVQNQNAYGPQYNNGPYQNSQQGQYYQQPQQQNMPPYNTVPPMQQRPKRRGCCSIILIIFGVLLLIGVISNLISGDRNSSTRTAAEGSAAVSESGSEKKAASGDSDKSTDSADAEQPEKDPGKLDLSAALERFETGGYAFVTLSDLDRYIINMTGQNVYTVVTIDEIDEEKIQANIGDGFMFQTFNTTEDYSPYFEEGDTVAIFGTVGDSQSLLTADWTEIDDSMVFAYGDAAKEYIKDTTDASMAPYLTVTEEVANAIGVRNVTEEEFKALCQTYSYEDILRNPDNYKKKYAVISGTVDQTIQGTLDLYTSVFIVDAYGNKWGANISYSEGQSRILEGDYVTIYGILDGTRKTETVLGKQVTLPYIDIEYVQY